MKARVLIRTFLVAVMLCITFGSSFAATWYVKEAANGGSDGAAGTSWAVAFATVQKAVDVSAASGDIIYVAKGTYLAQIYINEKSVTIEGGLDGGYGAGTTTFKAPTFGTLTNYTDATLLPAAVVGTIIESATFRPVVYVNTSSNTFVNNIYNVTVDGDNQYANVPATSHLFCGIVYRNSNGTVGQSDKPVVVTKIKGATVIDKKACFGIFIFGRSQATIQFTTVNEWQNAAIAVIGNNTSSLASTITQQPIPSILDCRINGTTSLSPISMANDRAGVLYANGARTYTRRSVFCSVENTGAGFGYGMFTRDGRAITFGDLTLKTSGNVITGCEIGVGVTVTVPLSTIDPATQYTIRNNNIVYNGNGASDATASGAARFEHQPGTNGTLNLLNNAWGNSAASTLYTIGNTSANAFWSVNAGDGINYIGALSSAAVIANVAFVGTRCSDLEYGFIDFPSLQQAVNGVAPCGTIQLNSNVTENIVINKCLTLLGNPGADCGLKPLVVGASNSAPAIEIIPPAENVTIDGILVDKHASATNFAYGILSHSTTNTPSGAWPGNNSPRNIFIRNTCFRGFTNETPAAISTDADGESSNAGFISGSDLGIYPTERDVDASFNNLLNYQTTIPDIQSVLMDRNDTPNPGVDVRAQVIPPTIFVIPCGSLIQPFIDAASDGATLYIQGACAYVENLVFNKQIYIDVSYTGRPLISPVLHARTDNGVGAHTFSSTGCNVGWWGDNTAINKPPVRFERAATPGVPYPNPLVSTFGTLRPNYWVIPATPLGICLQTAHDSLATGGATMEFPGGGTANYTVNLTINKLLTLLTPSGVRGLGTGQTLQTNPGADVSRTGGGTWDAPTVVVNTSTNSLTGNTGVGSIQQGIHLATDCGVVNVNSQTTNGSNYSAQTPIIDQLLHSLNGIDTGSPDFPTVTSITMSGSGNCAACSGNLALINNVNVPLVMMTNGADCIQKALGTPGTQNLHGVGNLPTAGTRTGEIRFMTGTYGTTANEAITVDKDVKFTGSGGSVANSNILTMRLGAFGTAIDASTQYCNNTVNVEQTAGSGFTQIPDIQTGILLACTGQLVNVGNSGAATVWGSVSDTYNRDNTINKSLTVQGRNNPTQCAFDNVAYVVNGSAVPLANASRTNVAAFNSGFAITSNPVFAISASTVTLRGFDFTNITGTSAAIIGSTGDFDAVTIENLKFTNNAPQHMLTNALSASSWRNNWIVQCNQVTTNAYALASSSVIDLSDVEQLQFQDNYADMNGSAAGNELVTIRGVRNNVTSTIQRNLIRSARRSGLHIAGATNNTSYGNLTITQNEFNSNNTADLLNWGGLSFETPQTSANGTINVNQNFALNQNTATNGNGIVMRTSGNPINHTNFSINNNRIAGNTYGLRYSANNGGATVSLNARGNCWGNASGPRNNYNPLNPTVCTSVAAFGNPAGETISAIVGYSGDCSTNQATWLSYTPWDNDCTDDAPATDGYQTSNADYLRRVVRTDNTGAFETNSHQIMTGTVMSGATANDIITVIQGNPAWTPTFDATGGDNWGDYFSETVALSAATPLLVRGYTTYEFVSNALAKFSTFLAGTGNVTAPNAGTAPATTITGEGTNGFTVGANSQTIRNFYIQGYSSSTPGTTSAFQGAAIRIPTGFTGYAVEMDTVNGSNTASRGSFGVVVEGNAAGTIGGSATTGNLFGATVGLSTVNSGDLGGVGVHFDANSGAMGNNTISNNVFGGTGSGSTGMEQAAVRVDNTTNTGTLNITTNSIRQVRDAAGNGGSAGTGAAKAAIYFNNLNSAAAGTVNVTVNSFGSITTGEGNKVDILVEGAGTNTGWALNVASNSFRAEDQTVDAINYLIQDDRAAGTSGPFMRNVFGFNNGTTVNNLSGNNTFSHAAVLTSTPSTTWNYNAAITRTSAVNAISGTRRIYRQIVTPINALNTANGDHVVELRENAAFALGTLGQYYHEDNTFPEVLAGGSHDNNYNLLLLGPTTAGTGTSAANLIAATSVAVSSTGRQNRDIRGGIVFHANSGRLYGAIPAGVNNRGDVYLQGQGVGADNGFVQFAYSTAFGSQAAVTGKGTETGGTANADANKPTIIKAGLSDADDDVKNLVDANNRRTGVFLYGNSTQFTRPIENPTPGLTNGEQMNAYPNPLKNEGTLTVDFIVPTDSYVKMALFNALGQKVAELPAGDMKAGSYTTTANVSGLPSGTYTIRMDYDVFTAATQVMIIR